MAAPDRDDAPFDPKDPTRPERAPRPRDAATLILIRRDGPGVRVLMGRRSRGHDFMPDKYVFPGGRVDRHDRFGPAASELAPPVLDDLSKAGARRAGRAFALAAVREMWEETGLVVGVRHPGSGAVRGPWSEFARSGALPHLAPLQFVARAITPPYRPKRFDARFFMAEAESCLLDERPARDGAELQDLRWFALQDAMTLDLPNVTRFVLGEIAERLAREGERVGPPFLRWTRKGHRMDRL